MTQPKGATIKRRWLGVELRRMRDGAKLSCEQVGRHLECSASKISRIEKAKVPVRTVDVQALCALYGANEEQTNRLVALARASKNGGWWLRYEDVLPDWFETFIGLESDAARVYWYEIQVVPGLLQTEAYARAVLEDGDLSSPEEIERGVAMRMDRQQLLARDDPPRLWVVLSEAVLRREIGGAEVMADQLDHLAEATRRRNVTVQVIPYDRGAHPGGYTPFVMLGFPEGADVELVYIDYLTGALYLDQPAELDGYTLAFNHLVAAAEPPKRSADLLREVAQHYRDREGKEPFDDAGP